jgi:hypothetical protein
MPCAAAANGGDIVINGAAARLVQPGDAVIIFSYASYAERELEGFEPTFIFVDGRTGSRRSAPADLLEAAAAGDLPGVVAVGRDRRAHMRRVSELLGDWATGSSCPRASDPLARRRVSPRRAARGAARRAAVAGAPAAARLPASCCTAGRGGGAAARGRRRRRDLLRAVAYHTLGHPALDELGAHFSLRTTSSRAAATIPSGWQRCAHVCPPRARRSCVTVLRRPARACCARGGRCARRPWHSGMPSTGSALMMLSDPGSRSPAPCSRCSSAPRFVVSFALGLRRPRTPRLGARPRARSAPPMRRRPRRSAERLRPRGRARAVTELRERRVRCGLLRQRAGSAGTARSCSRVSPTTRRSRRRGASRHRPRATAGHHAVARSHRHPRVATGRGGGSPRTAYLPAACS